MYSYVMFLNTSMATRVLRKVVVFFSASHLVSDPGNMRWVTNAAGSEGPTIGQEIITNYPEAVPAPVRQAIITAEGGAAPVGVPVIARAVRTEAEEKEPLAEEKEPLAEEKEPLAEEKEPLAEEKEPLAEEKEPLAEEKEKEEVPAKLLGRRPSGPMPWNAFQRVLAKRHGSSSCLCTAPPSVAAIGIPKPCAGPQKATDEIRPRKAISGCAMRGCLLHRPLPQGSNMGRGIRWASVPLHSWACSLLLLKHIPLVLYIPRIVACTSYLHNRPINYVKSS